MDTNPAEHGAQLWNWCQQSNEVLLTQYEARGKATSLFYRRRKRKEGRKEGRNLASLAVEWTEIVRSVARLQLASERRKKTNKEWVRVGRSVWLLLASKRVHHSFSAHLAKHPLLVSTSSRERTPRSCSGDFGRKRGWVWQLCELRWGDGSTTNILTEREELRKDLLGIRLHSHRTGSKTPYVSERLRASRTRVWRQSCDHYGGKM